MRILYFILPFLFVFSSLSSQENSRNYILTRTMLDESGAKYIENVQYYDGLGRPFLNVQKGVTPSRGNLATLHEYDGFGRESKAWLPYVTTSNYVDPAAYINSVSGTYNGDSRPYNETVYEHSPLNRVIAQHGPGAAWETHPVSTSYLTNTSGGELSCKLYYVTSSGALAQNGLYAANELYIVKNTDEDGNVAYLFTDKLGRQLLSRQMSGSVAHDTYYVYDDFSNRRFVLPPAYQDTPSLALYAYQYKYDERNRCVEKTLPGCEAIKYVYDKADNLIFSQDGVQRAKGEWIFYLYDVFSRPVLQGSCTNSNAASVNNLHVKVELVRNISTRKVLPTGIGETGYSSSFEINRPTIHIVNYYDDYTFLDIKGFGGKEGGDVDATGFLTGNITFLLNGSEKYCSVTHYDIKGRPVKVVSDNAMGGTETTTTTYTFTGKPLTVQNIHTASIQSDPHIEIFGPTYSHTETYRYTYDHAERPTKVTHQLDAHPLVTLSENEYDELGRLHSKTFHNNTNLKSGYSYNIRNWLTGISGNAFKQNLYYNTGTTACYNGNIGEMEWSFSNSFIDHYKYSYDGLNRLLSADYHNNLSRPVPPDRIPNFSEKVLEYDKQGNIRRLQRFGKKGSSIAPLMIYGLIDDLSMNYIGNQLVQVNDDATDPLMNGSFNYVDLNKSTPDFAYDANGNLTKDLDKQITSISYNSLNLPSNIEFANNGNSRNTTYNYDASGVKRNVAQVTAPPLLISPMVSFPGQGGSIGGSVKRYINSTIYCGNAIYDSSFTEYEYKVTLPVTNLARILTEEGYITLNDTAPVYHYYAKDYLGNVRAVINQDGLTVEQSNGYYAFGGIFNSMGGDVQPYKFGGKELDRMHGLDWYDSGARYLRNDAPGWTSMDPMCEMYYSWSPYAYCMNNPVKYRDPTGKYVESAWDIFSLVTGAKSFVDNVRAGNIGAAVVDGLGVVVDAAAVIVPGIPGGVGVAAKGVRALDKAADVAKAVDKTNVKPKTYQTYTKTNRGTGEVYSGRTSGVNDPKKNVENRDRNHHKTKDGFDPAELDQTSSDSKAIRGREQQMIEKHGGAKSQGGTSGNAINGVGINNDEKEEFFDTAKKQFGMP